MVYLPKSYKSLYPAAKKNKYKNIKTEIDGVKFDSKKEAKRYQELKLLLNLRFISDLVLQPVFILQDKFKYNGKTERAIKYIADFQYIKNGETIVEDVKGKKIDVYKIKKKLLLKKYPDINFVEI